MHCCILFWADPTEEAFWEKFSDYWPLLCLENQVRHGKFLSGLFIFTQTQCPEIPETLSYSPSPFESQKHNCENLLLRWAETGKLGTEMECEAWNPPDTSVVPASSTVCICPGHHRHLCTRIMHFMWYGQSWFSSWVGTGSVKRRQLLNQIMCLLHAVICCWHSKNNFRLWSSPRHFGA